MPKILCFGKGSLVICISQLILPSKPIRLKYYNHPKKHKIENLVLIAEEEDKIRRNSGVSNVTCFCVLILKVSSFTPQSNIFI